MKLQIDQIIQYYRQPKAMSATLPSQSFNDSIHSPDISAPIDPSLTIQEKMVQKKTHLLSVTNILLFMTFALLVGVLCYTYAPSQVSTNNYEQTSKTILQQSKTSPLPLNGGKHIQTPSGSGSKNGNKPSTASPTHNSKTTSAAIGKTSDKSSIGGNPDGRDDDGEDQEDENPNKKQNPIFGGGQEQSQSEQSSDDQLPEDLEYQQNWGNENLSQTAPLIGATAP